MNNPKHHQRILNSGAQAMTTYTAGLLACLLPPRDSRLRRQAREIWKTMGGERGKELREETGEGEKLRRSLMVEG